MTTVRRQYVLATFITSCVALILLIVAIATNYWISSSVESSDLTIGAGNVHYGLFAGTYSKGIFSSQMDLDITLVCDFGENACLWTCVVDKDRRKEELTSLLQGGAANIIGCSGTRLVKTYSKHLIRDNKDASTEKRFINAGLWLCTVTSLVLGLVLTAMSALFSLLNTVSNPTKPILSVDGLYYWNGFSALLDLLCLILWGVQFAITLKHNVAINETADKVSPTQYTSDGLSSIGWSYWMVLLALIFSAANICILFVRDYLIRKQPPTPEYNPEREVADGTLFLY